MFAEGSKKSTTNARRDTSCLKCGDKVTYQHLKRHYRRNHPEITNEADMKEGRPQGTSSVFDFMKKKAASAERQREEERRQEVASQELENLDLERERQERSRLAEEARVRLEDEEAEQIRLLQETAALEETRRREKVAAEAQRQRVYDEEKETQRRAKMLELTQLEEKQKLIDENFAQQQQSILQQQQFNSQEQHHSYLQQQQQRALLQPSPALGDVFEEPEERNTNKGETQKIIWVKIQQRGNETEAQAAARELNELRMFYVDQDELKQKQMELMQQQIDELRKLNQNVLSELGKVQLENLRRPDLVGVEDYNMEENFMPSFSGDFHSNYLRDDPHSPILSMDIEPLTSTSRAASTSSTQKRRRYTGDSNLMEPQSPYSRSEVSSVDSSAINNLSQKLDTVLSLLLVPQKPETANKKNSQQPGMVSSDTLSLVRNAKSVDDICSHLPNFKLHYETEESKNAENSSPNGLYCQNCSNEVGGTGRIGVLTYDFSKGDSFKYTKQPREFINMKNKIIEHVNSDKHLTSIRTQMELEEMMQEHQPRNEKVGMNLGRLCFKSIVEHHSQSAYEKEVAYAAALGVDVGHKCQTRKFPAEMTTHFHAEMVNELRTQLNEVLPGTGRPTPIALFADGYTPNRETLDIVGANVYLQGRLESVYLQGAVVRDQSGNGVADSFIEAATGAYGSDRWKERFVGTASDGGMLNTNYYRRLDANVNPSIDPESLEKWYSHSWDRAHLLERVEDDVKELPNGKFAKKRMDQISKMHHQTGYGKSLREIKDRCQAYNAENETNLKVRTPAGFSETRWATYAVGVFDCFQNNYRFLYDRLHDNQMDDLNKINNVRFVVETNALGDIYDEISKLSLTYQTPDLYPWHLQEAYEESAENLQHISTALNATTSNYQELENVTSTSEINNSRRKLLPRTAEAVKEVSSSCTYKDKPLLAREHLAMSQTTRSRSANVEYADQEPNEAIIAGLHRAGDYADLIRGRMTARLQDTTKRTRNQNMVNRPSVVKQCEEIFSMRKILARGKINQGEGTVVPNELYDYATAAKQAGFLERHITNDQLRSQYLEFAETVENKFGDLDQAKMSRSKFWTTEKKFYQELLLGKHNATNFKDINHLIAASTLRTQCESIAEGMGSVAKTHQKNRPIAMSTLNKEVYLHWNGSAGLEMANPLIERSLDSRFGGRNKWDFIRVTQRPDKLKLIDTSIVVDRVNKDNQGRVRFVKPKL